MNNLSFLPCLSNEFALATDDSGGPADWIKIPYGDHPHANGIIQRLTPAAAKIIADNYTSISAKLGRLFGGDPIYIGHPDDPALANQYPDKKAYGWIKDIQARPDGLYLAPKWGPAGLQLLSNAHFKFFSPRWGCRPLPGQPKIVDPIRIAAARRSAPGRAASAVRPNAEHAAVLHRISPETGASGGADHENHLQKTNVRRTGRGRRPQGAGAAARAAAPGC